MAGLRIFFIGIHYNQKQNHIHKLSIPVSLSPAPHSGNQNPPHPWLTTTNSSKPLFIHLPEKRSRVATKASLSRTNEASLSAVISRLEHERQGLTDGSGERWRRMVAYGGGFLPAR
ncbi:hypothetical protein YC2023_002326 [Brassica napus]